MEHESNWASLSKPHTNGITVHEIYYTSIKNNYNKLFNEEGMAVPKSILILVCWQWLIELEKACEYMYHGTVFGRKEDATLRI